MPFNGAGTFQRVHDWTQDRANGVTVNADRMDAEHDGFATGLSTAITKDGQTTITDDIPFNGNKITGLGAATTAGDAVRYEQLFAGVPTVITATPTTLDSSHVGKLNSFDCTGSAITVTLPSAVDVGNGAELTVVKTDPSGNFLTVTSVNDELLGYPSAKYSFHGTAGTAVSNVGGFVRVTMSTENTVFATGDKVRIAGAVGFAALNDDFEIERPTTASGVSRVAIDLTLAYSAGYTSGGTVSWIQTSQIIRVCNGTVTYVSNGTHWVVKYSTSDVWTGPKDDLWHQRNPGYLGPDISVTDIDAIDGYYNAYNLRSWQRSGNYFENGDAVDAGYARFERDYLSLGEATSLPDGTSIVRMYGSGSNQNGTVNGDACFINFIVAEDVTTAGHAGTMRIGVTPRGKTQGDTRINIVSDGSVWLGGLENIGSFVADPSLLHATGTLSGAVNASDGETVTIDGTVYTFESGAIDAAFKVDIGSTALESLENLAHAINLTGTSGTTYGAGTTIHPTVHAVAGDGGNNTMVVYAKTAGSAGNAIATTDTSAYTWAAVTLEDGEDANTTFVGIKGEASAANGGVPRVVLRSGSLVSGAHSHVGLRFATKGNGFVHSNRPFITNGTAASLTTAGDLAYTFTQFSRGIIVRDCAGAGRSDTLPDADDMVTAIPGVEIGDVMRCYIVNGSDAAETITLGAGAGGGWDAAQTAASRVIPQNTSKYVHIRFTNVTAASEAYVAYA